MTKSCLGSGQAHQSDGVESIVSSSLIGSPSDKKVKENKGVFKLGGVESKMRSKMHRT